MITNARIHTQDAAHRLVAALAVQGNAILATGSDADMRALAGPKTRIVDLGGRVVLPGLIDAHIHPAQSAQDLDKCNLHDRRLGAAEVKAAIADCMKARRPAKNEWFEVVQVNASALVLSRAELDGIRSDGPLVHESADGHSGWGNDAALAAAHIDRNTRDPRGGRIERDPHGEATGALRDAAEEMLLAEIPKPPVAVQAERLERAFALMNATGLTSVPSSCTRRACSQPTSTDARCCIAIRQRSSEGRRALVRLSTDDAQRETDRESGWSAANRCAGWGPIRLEVLRVGEKA